MKKFTTPIITEMLVIPVAGYDSMLLSLSGAHAPIFTRNIVILKDSSGNSGIGEIHGGEVITEALNGCVSFVVGQPLCRHRSVISLLRSRHNMGAKNSEGLQNLALSNLKDVVHSEMAVEAAMLDLLGQFMNMPVCDLLGDGRQRYDVPVLGYLFYQADSAAAGLPYISGCDSGDEWEIVRRQPAMTSEAIVRQARAAKTRYGFKDFKLKGGVLPGEREMETVAALSEAFPDSRVNIDPNGAWSLEEAIRLCAGQGDILAYAEDPCGSERGYSGRETMAEFKMFTGIPTATNMIATDWKQLYHAIVAKAVDIVLADPHFWTMSGSVRVSQLLGEWGLTWGSHSNNHFDVSLSIFAHCAAAAAGDITAMDTHWIWQDGQHLTKNPLRIRGGRIRVPDAPGLGLEIDMDAIMKANELYKTLPYGSRNDAEGMQHLIPGWKFDSKKPCMAR